MSSTKFVKLVTGETVMGTYNEHENKLEDVALIQVVPSSAGIQIAIVPYGFPFEEKIKGSIPMDKVVYEFEDIPSDIESKYIQAKSNITISTSMPNENPLGGMSSQGSDKVVDLENLFNKQ